jgi:hypothetical protein
VTPGTAATAVPGVNMAPVDPLMRKRLDPRHLAVGAVCGVVIGACSIFTLGSEGQEVVSYAGLTLAVVLTAPWLFSALYLRTGRGRAARDEYWAMQKRSQGKGRAGRRRQA